MFKKTSGKIPLVQKIPKIVLFRACCNIGKGARLMLRVIPKAAFQRACHKNNMHSLKT